MILKGKKKVKKYYLNFNNYHTWHPFVRNSIKQQFEDQVAPLLNNLPKLKTITMIEYSIYHKDNRRFDVSNKLALIDKYTQDAIVASGKIEDDNFHYIKSVKYCYGGRKESNYATVEIFSEDIS